MSIRKRGRPRFLNNKNAKKNLTKNRIDNTNVSGDTSLAFPVMNLMIVYAIRPKPIPCPIEPEIGIAISIMNTGTHTEISSKSMFFKPCNIKIPT